MSRGKSLRLALLALSLATAFELAAPRPSAATFPAICLYYCGVVNTNCLRSCGTFCGADEECTAACEASCEESATACAQGCGPGDEQW